VTRNVGARQLDMVTRDALSHELSHCRMRRMLEDQSQASLVHVRELHAAVAQLSHRGMRHLRQSARKATSAQQLASQPCCRMQPSFDGRDEIIEFVSAVVTLSIDEERRSAIHATAHAAQEVGANLGLVFSTG
jgi:hypothetical protein